jgi:hypothetical protein
MREFFSQYGKVIDSTVMLDRETGRSKGFGFVSFEDTNVQPFLGFGNLEIDGKLVRDLARVLKVSIIHTPSHRSMSSSRNPGTNGTATRTRMAQVAVISFKLQAAGSLVSRVISLTLQVCLAQGVPLEMHPSIRKPSLLCTLACSR